jgi:hypothetical protein
VIEVAAQEFRFIETRWAKLTVADTLTQADVDEVFASVDTSGWVTRPTWDNTNKVLHWQVIASPYGQLTSLGSGAVVCVERPYLHGAAMPPSPQAQVVIYDVDTWSDDAVSYLP